MKKLIISSLLAISFFSSNIVAKDTFLGALPDGLEFGKPIPEDIRNLYVGKILLKWPDRYELDYIYEKVTRITYCDNNNHFISKSLEKQGVSCEKTTLNELIEIIRKHKNVKWEKRTRASIEFTIEDNHYQIIVKGRYDEDEDKVYIFPGIELFTVYFATKANK